MRYHGVATLEDGSVLEKDGTITELCEWADKVASESGGNVQINVALIRVYGDSMGATA